MGIPGASSKVTRKVRDAFESIEIEPPEFNDVFEHRQDDFARPHALA
jgi:hypothetical protein